MIVEQGKPLAYFVSPNHPEVAFCFMAVSGCGILNVDLVCYDVEPCLVKLSERGEGRRIAAEILDKLAHFYQRYAVLGPRVFLGKNNCVFIYNRPLG